jgi:Werner syndrome ATP-dependent helicase
MSGDEDLWGDEDDDLFAMVDQPEAAGITENKDDDPFDDGEDDALMQSVLEISAEEDKIEGKDKADEDSFEALNLVPPTSQQNHFLKTNFGHSAFKPLQWRIVRSVMEERRDQCVVMATGYGKSLCYQFQAVYQVS